MSPGWSVTSSGVCTAELKSDSYSIRMFRHSLCLCLLSVNEVLMGIYSRQAYLLSSHSLCSAYWNATVETGNMGKHERKKRLLPSDNLFFWVFRWKLKLSQVFLHLFLRTCIVVLTSNATHRFWKALTSETHSLFSFICSFRNSNEIKFQIHKGPLQQWHPSIPAHFPHAQERNVSLGPSGMT